MICWVDTTVAISLWRCYLFLVIILPCLRKTSHITPFELAKLLTGQQTDMSISGKLMLKGICKSCRYLITRKRKKLYVIPGSYFGRRLVVGTYSLSFLLIICSQMILDGPGVVLIAYADRWIMSKWARDRRWGCNHTPSTAVRCVIDMKSINYTMFKKEPMIWPLT